MIRLRTSGALSGGVVSSAPLHTRSQSPWRQISDISIGSEKCRKYSIYFCFSPFAVPRGAAPALGPPRVHVSVLPDRPALQRQHQHLYPRRDFAGQVRE